MNITLAYSFNKQFLGNDDREIVEMVTGINQDIEHIKASEFDLVGFMHNSGLWFGTAETIENDTKACTLTISKYGWKLETKNSTCLDMYPECTVACGPGDPPDEVVKAGFPTIRR